MGKLWLTFYKHERKDGGAAGNNLPGNSSVEYCKCIGKKSAETNFDKMGKG